MSHQKVRLICYAWGEAYVDRLLSYAVAATLAPGNLPALTRVFDCTFVILTERRLFGYVRAHPITRQVEALCPLRLLPLDDLVAEPWQYGLTVAYSLFRGITDLGSEAPRTYCLFLNADFVLADGCYEALIPRILAGEHLHLSPSYCVAEERILPDLEARRAATTQVLAIPKREMAALVLEHRHNTIRAKTVNQDLFHFRYMDQFYWDVDLDTLIGHQMPIAMIGVRPEIVPADLNTFWDWGIVYELCPSKNLRVLGDSDDFLMLELRAEATHLDLICAGRDTPAAMASRMTGYITQYQVDNARFPLTLHAADLPSHIDAARAKLRAVIGDVLRHLPSKPIDHANHEQWRYHKAQFELYQRSGDLHSAIRTLEAEVARLEAERKKHLAESGQDVIDVIEAAAQDADRGLTSRLLRDVIDAELANRRQQIRTNRARLSFKRRLISRVSNSEYRDAPRALSWKQRLFNLVMGRFPDMHIWHPFLEAHLNLLKLGPDLMRATERCLFVIWPQQSHLQAIGSRFGKSSTVVHAEELIANSMPGLLAEADKFDGCAIVFIGPERHRFAESLTAAAPLLRSGAKVLIHWINTAAEAREVWEPDLVKVLTSRVPQIKVTYRGSRAIGMAMRHYNGVRGSGTSLIRLLIASIRLGAAAGYATIAYVQRRCGAVVRSDAPLAMCSSVTIVLEQDSVPPMVRSVEDEGTTSAKTAVPA